MEIRLPSALSTLLQPLFEALPLDRAMPALVVGPLSQGRGAEQYEDSGERAYIAAAHAIESLDDHPALQAGLWLYVDDLERSHAISQNIHTPEGSYWHGILHRREGDFSNAKYWFRQSGNLGLSVEPIQLVDRVQAAKGANPEELLQLQRQEWAELFSHCAKELG